MNKMNEMRVGVTRCDHCTNAATVITARGDAYCQEHLSLCKSAEEQRKPLKNAADNLQHK